MSTMVTLNLKQGKIKGEQISSPDGRNLFKFFGIPYAKPPVGQLRFANPQALEKFTSELLDCTKEQNASMQYNVFSKEVFGSEDCLYLNVFTPKIKSDKKLPVMVYIHGGGFMTGTGNRHIEYPKYLLQEDIILVTVNYRLGAFGFLSLPNGGISGNFGLKDQQMALKWVNQNIDAFNGNPKNVTLFGASAGGASVHYQLLSLESRKYFQRVICQSGLATFEWALEKNPEAKALKLAEILGFKGKSDIEIGNFLRNYDNVNELIKNMHNVLTKNESRHPLRLPFSPVVEPENVENPFITTPPYELLKDENFLDNIPIMAGYDSMEGIMIVAHSSRTIEDIDGDLACAIPATICDPDDLECINIAEKVRSYYFQGKKIDKKQLAQLSQLVGDVTFVYDFYKSIKLHTQYQKNSPLYCFKFSYDGKFNGYKIRYKMEIVPGACHGDEMYYLFYPNELTNQIEGEEGDIVMVNRICKLWANFAKYGDPTPIKDDSGQDDVIDFVWKPTVLGKKGNLELLDINKKCEMKVLPDDDRMKFWDSVVKN